MERKGQKIPGPTCSILITAVRLYLALRTKYGQRSMLDLLLVLFRGYLQQSSGEGDGTHSSTLVWKIPWMEEPGGLQSMGS